MGSQPCFSTKYQTTSMWPLKAATYKGLHWHCTQKHKYMQYSFAFKNVVTPSYLSCPFHSGTSLEVLAASQYGCCMQQSVPLSSHNENGENDVTVIALELTEDGIRYLYFVLHCCNNRVCLSGNTSECCRISSGSCYEDLVV